MNLDKPLLDCDRPESVVERTLDSGERAALQSLPAGKPPNPSAADISHSMQGNICRCGTHPRIVAAIQRAAKTMNHSMKESGQ